MVDAIGSSFLSNATTTSKAGTSKSLFEGSSETYLGLFLTQLKNQDPSEPFDTAQMTEQLAQLNTSQQLIDVNGNLETLISSNNTTQASAVANFINKDVKYIGNEVYSTGDNVNEISYTVDKSYDSTSIEIRDEFGELINKTEGENSTGSHSLFWNGTDTAGNPVAEGRYYVTVYGDDNGTSFDELTTMVSGIVSGIDFMGSGEPVLKVGFGDNARNIELKDIAAINDYNGAINRNTNNTI